MDGFKHTKGPWAFQKCAFVGRVHPANDSSRSIATVYRHKKANKIKRYHDDEESTANGLLITASPEMRDALIHQYRWVKSLYDLYRIDERAFPDSDLIKTERDLRELIERATGLTIDEAIKAWEEEHK